MSSNESSGAPAEATATTPAPAAEFPTFGTTRGSGLARGKRPSAGPATTTAAAPSDYKPTAIEVVNAPREYTNPFAPVSSEPTEAAATAPVVEPPAAPAPTSVVADLTAVTSAQVAAPTPEVEEEPAQLNILPPAEQRSAPAQTWESEGFRPSRDRGDRPRREERRDEPAAEEEVDISSIPPQFLYVRPGVKFVPTPRNWGGAPRERGDRSKPAEGAASSAPRAESPRASAPAAAPAKSGGLFGWIKSLFGGSSETESVPAGHGGEPRREGGERRHRGGRNRGGRGPGGGEGGGHRRHRGGRNRHRSGGGSESGGPAT
jgi:translation initiation factor IF-2